MTSNYTIGYGRPPIKSQFQKGKSGNPKGRPKLKPSSDPLKIIIAELKSPITLTEGGKKKKMRKLDALVKGWVAHALKGDKALLKILLDRVMALPKDALLDEKEIEADKRGIEALERFVAEVSEYAVRYQNDAPTAEGKADDHPPVTD